MNELQSVAEGDLTQQATVTEDITGAIADSVNYTVEELRTLVAQVQGTANRVTDTTGQVEQTSTELLAASTEQLHEIRETGESVLQMAGRINDVSQRAQETVAAAQQSLNVTPDRPPRGAERHRGHELDPRPDPGNLQADQAPRRIVAGDRRNHRADFRHYRADERAGAERRHPGRIGRRSGSRLLGGCGRSAATGRTLRRRDAPDRGAGEGHSDRHRRRRGRHGTFHAGRGAGCAAVRRGRCGAGRHRPCDARTVRRWSRASRRRRRAKRSPPTSWPPTSSTSSR